MSVKTKEIFRQISIGLVSVAIVFSVTMALTRFVQTDVSTLYLAAVIFAAWRGGLGAGLIATSISVVIAVFFFLSPVYSFTIEEGLVELIVFASAAVLVSSLAAGRERALKREMAARQEAEKANRVKDEFLATASHELRTPLTTIKALARLLLRQDPPEEKRREYLETISVECDRQIDLVLNLLDTSRIEGGVFRVSIETVDVEEIIRSCVNAESRAAARRGHKLDIELNEEVPPVCADPKALRRVLSNVIENAIKYTPDGGVITVSAQNDNGSVSIAVTDNGRGIPSEDLPGLFDKFRRGNPAPHSNAMRNATEQSAMLEDADVSGVGLGLYLAKNVMEQMGGKILVETEVGRGSTFRLQLSVSHEGDCKGISLGEEENGKALTGS